MIKLQNNLELNFICGGMLHFPSAPVIKRVMVSRPVSECSDTQSEWSADSRLLFTTPALNGEQNIIQDNNGIEAPCTTPYKKFFK